MNLAGRFNDFLNESNERGRYMDSLSQALSQLDRAHQIQFFIETTCMKGPSKQERTFAEYIEPILLKLGFSVEYDEACRAFGGNCGNLIACWPGTDPGAEPLMFSAHMDTVLDSSHCKPIVKDGLIQADGVSILGSDDRSAISAYIEAVRAIQASHMPCGPVELVLTVNEQSGLQGAKYLDASKLHSRFGYIFDHPGDVGQVITRSPYWNAFNIYFRMKVGAAGGHISNQAGVPNAFTMGVEAYRNMILGELDGKETVAMIGLMKGGERSSVVPGELYMRGEIRSFRKEYLQKHIEQIRSACEKAAEAYDGLVQFDVEDGYEGYEIQNDNLCFRCFCESAETLGIPWYRDGLLGGTDTNFIRLHGVDCITLGNGYKNEHTAKEFISIENLENMARMTICLINRWYRLHKNK